MRERRPPRTRIVGSEPIPVTAVAARPDDLTVEERIDGAISGPRSGFRRRYRSTEPLPFSTVQWLEALACFGPLWELAEEIDAGIAPTIGAGRHRECTTFEVLLFEVTSWEVRSYRAVHRTLADPATWQRLAAAVRHAWPDHPGRRLTNEGPSRSQHHRFRTSHLEHDDLLIRLRATTRALAVQAARTIGVSNPTAGSLTRPDTVNLIAGDATWLPALYDLPPDHPEVDPDTGEILERRRDPDAIPFHNSGRTCGRSLVSALARTPQPHERVILDLDFVPAAGRSDATVFTDMALDLFDDLPAMHGVVYDMALHAADIDRLLDAGRLPISKVQRTSRRTAAAFNLGPHTVRLPGNTTSDEPVTALDGTPCLTALDADGTPHYVPLTRRQTRTRPNADGSSTVYGKWRIPDHPVVPARLHGGEILIRHSSTSRERAENRRRTRALRPIPESDPTFDKVYGLREDTESMHHHLKERLWNGRARCVGLRRQRLNLHAYQIRTAMTALIAWSDRTGGDLSPWFGKWLPPLRAGPLAA